MTNKTKYIILYTSIAVILGVMIFGGIKPPKGDTIPTGSTLEFNVSPTASPTSASTELDYEPIPYAWEDYANEKFSFAISIPEKWHTQNYISDPKKGAFIAFDPDPLPCEDCTYLHDGFFAIKIYNQKTDPESYALFQQKLAAIGKKEGFRPAQINGKKGVWHENTVAVENGEWVYEIIFEKASETLKMEDSQILKRVFASFKFTTLEFN